VGGLHIRNDWCAFQNGSLSGKMGQSGTSLILQTRLGCLLQFTVSSKYPGFALLPDFEEVASNQVLFTAEFRFPLPRQFYEFAHGLADEPLQNFKLTAEHRRFESDTHSKILADIYNCCPGLEDFFSTE
jgi:hypothetical protein